MSKLKKMTAVLPILVVMAGCGSSTEEMNNSNNNKTIVQSFIVDSGSTTAGGVPIIDSNLNGGQFVVSWDVDSSDPYRAEIYVSENDVLNDTKDILGQNCGSLSQIYNCNSYGEFTCTFNTSNVMSCDVGSSNFNKSVDLTNTLNQLPQEIFITLKACDGLFKDCKTQQQVVELR